MTTLNLTLRGLCGLVPNDFVPREPTPNHPIRRLRILVLDAADLAARHQLNICHHDPRLIVGASGNAQQIFALNRHKIEIEGLTVGQPIRLQREFWDVAQMNQVTKDPFEVGDDFLLDSPTAGVIASLRLRLATGEVRGIDLSPQESDFQNGDAENSYRKRFARAVHLRLQLDGPGKIHLTRFGETNPEHSIDLVPEGDSVDITLINLCDPAPPAAEPEGADFAAFYKLLPAYPGPLFVPVESDLIRARARSEVRGEASGAQTGCVPTCYNDHPNA